MSAQRRDQDILKLVASKCHIGTTSVNDCMKKFVDHRAQNGTYYFKVDEILNRIRVAARVIVASGEPDETIVVSARPLGQRAVIKYAEYTGAVSTSTARWTPGTLTNQNTKKFKEPRLLMVTDPRQDRQPIVEASYVNIPCISLCDTDSSLQYVDIGIPCNNRLTESISMVYYLLAREVLFLRNSMSFETFENKIKVDLFYHRNIENEKRIEEEQGEIETKKEEEKKNEANADEEGAEDDSNWK